MEKPTNDLIQLGAALALLNDGRKAIEKLYQDNALGRIRDYTDTIPLPASIYYEDLMDDLKKTHRWEIDIKLISDLISDKVNWR